MSRRFGEFTIIEELGRSRFADRYSASHDSLGGPFFVKWFKRAVVQYSSFNVHFC